jgi:hypothetical protein
MEIFGFISSLISASNFKKSWQVCRNNALNSFNIHKHISGKKNYLCSLQPTLYTINNSKSLRRLHVKAKTTNLQEKTNTWDTISIPSGTEIFITQYFKAVITFKRMTF